MVTDAGLKVSLNVAVTIPAPAPGVGVGPMTTIMGVDSGPQASGCKTNRPQAQPNKTKNNFFMPVLLSTIDKTA